MTTQAFLNATPRYQPRLDHLSVADLCGELGIARSTFYDWRAAHKAPRCIKLPNGAIRIRRRDLDAWLESREEPT